ncbi:hypothetical protein F0562_001291 [Nyssa sinensis]|uniref:Uncharacterized protein n=1 Tax=Nyssa sinensis TaxID=561372 RepID=A0A5J5C7Q9_9ASTE|nr:hypothetical protein F0562_001291 [Nyssa sinensis]
MSGQQNCSLGRWADDDRIETAWDGGRDDDRTETAWDGGHDDDRTETAWDVHWVVFEKLGVVAREEE